MTSASIIIILAGIIAIHYHTYACCTPLKSMCMCVYTSHSVYIVVQTASCGYCSFASRLEEASIYQEPGTYFDCDHKLPCAGNIVSWHYCYYSADLAPYRNAYWIQVQVFRDIENSSFHHVYGQHIFLDNEPSNETFVCQKVMVSNPIPVQAGDFLGLHLPARISLPIPVVGHGLNGSVLYRDVGDASVTILERMDGLVLHVDAEIGKHHTVTVLF